MADFDVKKGYSAAFKTFVDFAQKTHNDGFDSANAKATLAGHRLTVSPLSLHETSNLLRKSSESASNNATRDLFRQAVADMFGGEAKIPPSVKDAMLLNDYGHGRPLTARRIMTVKAEVDSILKQHANFNNGIYDRICAGHIGDLPDEFKTALGELVNHLRGIFGEAAVPQNAVITNVLDQSLVLGELATLRDAANAQGRDLTKDQIVSVFAGRAFNMLADLAMGRTVLAHLKARNPGMNGSPRSIGARFAEAYPMVRSEILNCKNPAEIESVLLCHGAEIYSFVDVALRSRAISKTVVPQATARLAEELGLDSRIIATHVQLDALKDKATMLDSSIVKGQAPGCREKNYDIQAAYDNLVNRFVHSRVDACQSIDALDLPDDLKHRWKAEYLAFRSVPAITPAQLLEAARQIDTGRLLNALSPNLPTSVAATLLDSVLTDVMERIKTITGNAQVLVDMGAEDLMEIANMVIDIAKRNEPQLEPAILNVWRTLEGPIHTYCEGNRLNMGTVLSKMLVRSSGADMEPEIMPKHRYLAFVEEDTEAALDECEIIDENVRANVKERMRERGEANFALATGLKNLSDGLVAIKAEAKNIARQFVPEAPPAPGPVPEKVQPPRDVPKAVPVLGKRIAGGAKMPKITNQEQLQDFIRGLKLDTQFGAVHEDAKEPDAIGNERQTYTYRGIVFRTERRKMHELYDQNTMQPGFTSKKDLSVPVHKTEAMGLGMKGTGENGEAKLIGPGATGTSGVSCAKTIGGVIGYVGGGHTFYVIDTTKLPPAEKAWDMENTILKNGLLKTDESNGEVNVSYIPRKAIIGHVYVPAQSKVDNIGDNDQRWSLVRNLATGLKYEGLNIVFNPEYEA